MQPVITTRNKKVPLHECKRHAICAMHNHPGPGWGERVGMGEEEGGGGDGGHGK